MKKYVLTALLSASMLGSASAATLVYGGNGDPVSLEPGNITDGISLGVCPRSNLTLGIYPDWDSHPLRRLLDAGVSVTLNTDDPAPLGTTLEADWAVAAEQFGFDYADLVGFAARSIDASFADVDTKSRLHAELAAVSEVAPV